MAVIDYGAIAFKNGRLVSTGMFTSVEDMIGLQDDGTLTYTSLDTVQQKMPLSLNGRYFACIGDTDLIVCFYKTTMEVFVKCFDNNDTDYVLRLYEWFGSEPFRGWKVWKETIGVWSRNVHKAVEIKVKRRNGYYVCKMNYNGDKYKVYFGYGVDFDAYKKWHIVNYYRSLPFYWSNFIYNVSRLFAKFCRKKGI